MEIPKLVWHSQIPNRHKQMPISVTHRRFAHIAPDDSRSPRCEYCERVNPTAEQFRYLPLGWRLLAGVVSEVPAA